MATAPASNDVSRLYCSTDDVAPYILPHVIGNGPSNPLTVARVTSLIADYSRTLDGMLSACGFYTPFPDRVNNTGPSTPVPVRQWVTFRVAAQAAYIATRSTGKVPEAESLLGLCDEILARDKTGHLTGSIFDNSFMEFVKAEPLAAGTLGTPPTEYGWMGNTPGYRLRNRGLIIDSGHPLKFLDANYVEVRDTAGLPYGPRRLVSIDDASQSVIQVWDYSRIKGNAAYISYWFSWRDVNPFATETPFLTGVAGYGG